MEFTHGDAGISRRRLLQLSLGAGAAVAAAAAALAVFAVYRLWLTGEFGGISGDLAGWFVQVCELCALGAMVVAGKLMA